MGAFGSIRDGRLDEGEIQVSDKIEQFWRDATADDVARVMKGETVEARFRDEEHESWSIALLFGWSMDEGRDWIDSGYNSWEQCQVYDPPEWYINKPEPGEGYRLLEKFPHEPITGTDDYWSTAKAKWMPIVKLTTNKQPEKTWFRRRIEAKPTQCIERVCGLAKSTGVTCPHDSCDIETGVRQANNPVIPDSSNSSEIPNSYRSRDTIPSGWRLLGKDEERLASDAYWSLGAKDWIVIGDNRVNLANAQVKVHAIRQVVLTLRTGFIYQFHDGKFMKITAKGFEVV